MVGSAERFYYGNWVTSVPETGSISNFVAFPEEASSDFESFRNAVIEYVMGNFHICQKMEVFHQFFSVWVKSIKGSALPSPKRAYATKGLLPAGGLRAGRSKTFSAGLSSSWKFNLIMEEKDVYSEAA
jgi:hypothetical protein